MNAPGRSLAVAEMSGDELVGAALDELDTFKAYCMASFGAPEAPESSLPALEECGRRNEAVREFSAYTRLLDAEDGREVLEAIDAVTGGQYRLADAVRGNGGDDAA